MNISASPLPSSLMNLGQAEPLALLISANTILTLQEIPLIRQALESSESNKLCRLFKQTSNILGATLR